MTHQLLLVEDNDILRLSMERLLRKRIEVVTCATAEDALSVLRTGARFDVILSDYRLSNLMCGVRLFRAVREICAEQAARMLLMSGSMCEHPELEERWILKPFTIPELFESITALLLSPPDKGSQYAS